MDINTLIQAERILEYRKWVCEIPFIKFDPSWEIKIIPPFAFAVVRFLVKKGSAEVSIYLDCYDRLGYVGKPYWEIYPYQNDVFRCFLGQEEILLNAIRKSLDDQLSLKITGNINLK